MKRPKGFTRLKAVWLPVLILAPIVLIGLFFFKRREPIPAVFTSMPPPPRTTQYTPGKKPSALQIMDLHNVDTNRADIAALMVKVAGLETELSVLESNLYSTNLTLWTYQQYRGVMSKWYDSKPRQRQAWNKYEYPTGAVEAKRQKACGEILQMLPLVLVEELSRDPDFGPLIKGSLEPLVKLDIKRGVFGSDRLAGFWLAKSESLETWDDFLAAVHRRYPSYATAIQERIQTQNVPADVVSDIKDYSFTQTLGGLLSEIYVPLHTPKELTESREKLNKAIGELSWAREAKPTAKRD